MQLRPRDFEKVPYNHTETDYLRREYEHELQASRRRSYETRTELPYSDLDSGLDQERDSK